MSDYKNKHTGGSDEPTKPGLPQHTKPQNLTKDKLKKFLPKGSAHSVTDNIMNMIHKMESDTGIMQEYMEEAVLSNIGVFNTMKKLDVSDYIAAVKYCTLKNDMSNKKAWEIVFPEKMIRLEEMKLRMGDKVNIDSHVSNYNKTKIVTELETLMRVHASIQYAGYNNEAMMVRVNLMRGKGANPTDRVSPLVQLQAAEGVYADTKMPEDNSIELKFGMTDDAKSVQENLMDEIRKHSLLQAEAMKNGGVLNNVQKLGLKADAIDAEIEE